MVRFANPHLLYLLLLIPALIGLYVLAVYSRKKKLEKFGHYKVISRLMPDASKYMPSVKMVIELLALGLIVVALARPYSPAPLTANASEDTTEGIEVMICFDVSNSMLASSTDDPRGVSRMQRAKFILEKIIDKMRNDKVGLIVFAGDSYTQLPITSDYISAKMFLNSIDTGMVPTQGTAIGAAIDMAINSFTPESEFQKAIVLITDAENFEDNPIEAAKRAAESGIQIDVIGVGTAAGTPIPVNITGSEFMKDETGQDITTALDEKMAEEIAKAGKGIYIQGGSSSAVSELTDQLSTLAKKEYKRSSSPNPASELFPIAISLALILLLIDMLLPYSKIELLRKFTFFTKK
ncbi:MAG: VWA domain-containing protein [Muribaculaceae bacterium]|nr:VWA domain-containing protein [Muribaculaceae bacterium]